MGSISNRENETEYRESAQGSAEQTSYGWKGYLAYFAGYTGLFCLTAAAVFVWFYLTKRRFVWTTDGVNQHYYGLVYFSRWGKEVIRQFRETGIFRLPTFSLRMGYGEDLLTTLAYYVIGDPFSLPAVFVPERYMLAYHDIMLLVRFYLAGISFSAYNFCMDRKNRIGVLAGALVYVFNGFTLAGMRHHYFLNPFVFFPLLLIGCERYFRKKRPGLFIFMVFLTAVSNFYFFYMMVIMTVLYAAWRSFRLHGLRRLGRVILDGIAFVCYGLLGTLLSSVLFLPVILRFLQDPRTAYDKQIRLLWPAKYYMNFIDSFLTNGSRALGEYWTYMGFGAVAAFC
ncbi:MAG: YfhO family protein, partial [Lachnospiraceae bacterium]|nr:YfhO family protein [Lachnospiraceae bacterium]